MAIDKQKEIIELRKLYLTQFEKFETKVFLTWTAIILLPLFVLWIQNKMSGWLLLVIALFTCLLDCVIELWRKNNFNKLINEIKLGEVKGI